MTTCIKIRARKARAVPHIQRRNIPQEYCTIVHHTPSVVQSPTEYRMSFSILQRAASQLLSSRRGNSPL